MTITQVKIKDFMVFKGEFSCDFCSGVNVFIGGNATGKTTLLKVLYRCCDATVMSTPKYFNDYEQGSPMLNAITFDLIEIGVRGNSQTSIAALKSSLFDGGDCGDNKVFEDGKFVLYDPLKYENKYGFAPQSIGDCQNEIAFGAFGASKIPAVFIPASEMLTHSSGMLSLYNKYSTVPLDKTEIDILINAGLPEVKTISEVCKKASKTISTLIDGIVVEKDGKFSVEKSDGTRIPFSQEASGYKKLGLLWKLMKNGLLDQGGILFWDEPENSLNPEHMPVLVEILLDLQRSGAQIFLATHSELLASYLNALRKEEDSVMFTSLYKEDHIIKFDRSDRFDLLIPNNLKAEPVKLYEKEIERWLGNE
jgi:AAA15 family ATPase/GTPase